MRLACQFLWSVPAIAYDRRLWYETLVPIRYVSSSVFISVQRLPKGDLGIKFQTILASENLHCNRINYIVERAPETETSSHPDTVIALKRRCGMTFRKVLLDGVGTQDSRFCCHVQGLRQALK